jgi:hypothetical protein
MPKIALPEVTRPNLLVRLIDRERQTPGAIAENARRLRKLYLQEQRMSRAKPRA